MHRSQLLAKAEPRYQLDAMLPLIISCGQSHLRVTLAAVRPNDVAHE